MPLPTSLWIKTGTSGDWMPLTNVTDFKVGQRKVPDGTYRNGTWNPGTAQILASGSPTSQVATVPVVVNEASAVSTTGYSNLRPVSSDEVAGIPPHTKYVWKDGLYVAFNSAVIPDVVQESFTGKTGSVTSASATTNVLTMSTTSTFVDDDVVTIIKGASLDGVTHGTRYLYRAITTTTFLLLLESTGEVIDITGTPSGTHTVVLVEPAAATTPPDNLPSGVIWYPRPVDFSTVNPLA